MNGSILMEANLEDLSINTQIYSLRAVIDDTDYLIS